MITLSEIGIVVLDLDDTLFLERDYVRSGFEAVSQHLVNQGHSGFFDLAWSLFEQGLRGTTFDDVLPVMGIKKSPELVASLVAVYRSHKPVINLCPDADNFLRRLNSEIPLCLITDGPVITQSAKIESLNIGHYFKQMILTDTWGVAYRKPHPRAYDVIEAMWPGLPRSKFVYIADNPKKDFVTPNRSGWQSIRLMRPGGEHFNAPMVGNMAAQVVISTFDQLL